MDSPLSGVPAVESPAPRSSAPVGAPTVPQGTATIFESPLFDSFDGWARLLRQAGDAGCEPPPPALDTAPPEAGSPSRHPTEATMPWTPTRRPALSLLHVVDDGRDSGETVRLRGDTMVVGRTTGVVSIPHDPFLEEAHARLDRLPGGGWLLTDLGSRDGTWVRVTTARLRDGTALRVGSTSLVFRGDSIAVSGPAGQRTVAMPATPFLLGRTATPDAAEFPGGVPLLGLDDPFVSPLHAEVIERRGGPRIVNHGLNGLWVRLVAPVRLDATAQFQCGDQRFVLERLPPTAAGS